MIATMPGHMMRDMSNGPFLPPSFRFEAGLRRFGCISTLRQFQALKSPISESDKQELKIMDERKEQQDIREPWSERRVLDAWRAVVIGTSRDYRLDYPTVARDAESGDDEFEAYEYVAGLPGYYPAEPVLTWRIVDARPLKEFRVIQAGETLDEALYRLKWLDLRIYPPSGSLLVAVEDMAWWRYRTFRLELRHALRVKPYRGRLAAAVRPPITDSSFVDKFGKVSIPWRAAR